MMKSTVIGAAAIVFGWAAVPALAETAGEDAYQSACATCHGANGMGQGPLAEFMNVAVPNLRGLSAANDGVFPMLDIIHVIDGRTGVRGHVTEMPIWGNQFKAEVLNDSGAMGAEIYARGKILSLAYYLESIQE